jgi:ring-1,2-phenylacetyl-CoA epoxidase subunit PaaE
MPDEPYIPLKIVQLKNETVNVKAFVLEQSSGQPIRYQAGQFLTLIFKKGNVEDRRSYSIASTPSLGEPLTIAVKRVDNGEYSRHLFDNAKVGDMLLTIGASGYFTIKDDVPENVHFVFLAAGSGITPIFPLIKTLLYQTKRKGIHLLYSNRSPGDALFGDELATLAQKFPGRLNFESLYSISQNLLRARLTKPLLLHYLVQQGIDKSTARFYICGPFEYMQMATITLLSVGVPQQNIRRENFSTEKPVVKDLPPDVDPHPVTIYVRKSQYHLTVQYPLTILETAKRLGIALPYSCEAGKCGTCSATCVKGNVWHSYNEVLLDRELDRGRILTCTGYPYGDDEVVINIDDGIT